ncbi:MAG: hypothetical protein LBQ55_07910 [Treponema sp.]|jgi:hypothetical protein|nr:hypothetical protein [Treponema sp.]
MMFKRFLTALLLSLSVLPLHAAAVSFLVVETGLQEGQGASQYSSLYESGLLDIFFEAGHIVSNAPILRLSGAPKQAFPEEARPDLAEALAGGMEYFILAQLDYAVPAGEKIEKPHNVFLRIFAVNPCRLIYEQRYGGQALPTLDDEYLEVKQRARSLIAHLNDR